MTRVVDYITEFLLNQGAKHIFYVSGSGCMFMTDSLLKNKEVVPIAMNHEQAAGMAALAYAQQNETIGACYVTTGCGGTNTITAVLHAWQDGIPCVFISGQVKRNQTIRSCGEKVRQLGRQEADIIPIVSSITKFSETLWEPNDVAVVLERAFAEATTGRKGPVWIDVPLDVQGSMIDTDNLSHYSAQENRKPQDEYDMYHDWIKQNLMSAKRPVVLGGYGIRSAGAIKELNAFIEIMKIPFVYARGGADLIDSNSQYSIGMVGSLGANRAGNFAIANADFILCIGHRMNFDTIGNDGNLFARKAKVVMVDIDEAELNKNVINIDCKIHMDAKKFMDSFLKQYKTIKTWDEWVETCKHWKKKYPKCDKLCTSENEIDMYSFMEWLSGELHDNSSIVSDAGGSWQLAPSVIHYDGKGMRSINAYSQGEMGFSLPAGIGVWFAKSVGDSIVVTGDGSIMMNIQELALIGKEQIPIKIFVMNNQGYSSIRGIQRSTFRRTIGTEVTNGLAIPPFSKIAEAFSIEHILVSSRDEAKQKIRETLNYNGPVLCEVMCIAEQKFLQTTTKLSNRKMITTPIEDQYPFLPQDEIKDEMIIDLVK